ALVTALLGAGEPEALPQHVQQRLARVDEEVDRLAVDRERCLHRGARRGGGLGLRSDRRHDASPGPHEISRILLSPQTIRPWQRWGEPGSSEQKSRPAHPFFRASVTVDRSDEGTLSSIPLPYGWHVKS